MEKEEGRREESLKTFILAQIEEKGPIPFSQFMDWCLYHPSYGYYASERTKIGKDGDYYTSTCVHPLFGHLIAKQLIQMAEILGGETFDVIEMGGERVSLPRYSRLVQREFSLLLWAAPVSPH
jgi:SAM-dependent MidA family methyltransferase